MAGFDEILALEERQRTVESNFGQQKDLIRSLQRKISLTKTDLEQIRGHIVAMQRLIKDLRQDFVVVLLEEFATAQHILAENQELEKKRRADIAQFQLELREATVVIPQFEAELIRVERELSKFGKVLQFPYEPR